MQPDNQVRDDDSWQAALADFRAAQTAVREIEAATAGGGLEEEEALLPAHDSACAAMEAALGRLLRAPVPDAGALAVKYEAAFADELKAPADGDPRFAAVLRDIVRLHRDRSRAGL